MPQARVYNTVPVLWKSTDIADKRARSMRRLALGAGISLLLHALLLLIVPRHEMGAPAAAPAGPLVVQLSPRTVEAPPAATLEEPPPPPTPRRKPAAPNLMAVPKAKPENPVLPVTPPTPPAPEAEPAPSMMAMVEQARARRQQAESQARQGTPSPGGPSGDPAASLKRNLQTLSTARDGTSGVFQVLEKGHRTGQFAFRGWSNDNRAGWKEVIEVDAGPQGNVELAIVRKMIELIRQHYKGNFNWESHRLGRVVALSARIEDSAGLEEFLMREFFG